ncbi:MAG TPA: tetratricopeptide repeat protein [Ktedonobacterales bacterium]|nr:tetratricopeptide repeat protein [Ktedonobacterales bacterium]
MSTLPSLSFGALLRRYRLAAGLTQEALAERARLSRGAIDTLERGARHTPRKETLALLAEALGLGDSERALLEAAARQNRLPAFPLPEQSSLLQPGSSAAWPLVGRARELTALERHLAGEGPPVLLLAGEPGIGKTRLLHEAMRRAAEWGWTVLEGGCQRRSGQEPYAPLVGALEGHIRRASLASLRSGLDGCAWMVRLLPELAETTLVPAPSWTLPPEQERRLMFAAVGRFLANVAGPGGTLLVLDDLQWAGADALDVLVTLVRAASTRPLRIVGAYRTTEFRPEAPLSVALADLAAAGLAAQQQLGPLAQEEAQALLQQVLAEGGPPGAERAEQVLARTGGVPFFLVSCAEALRAEGPGQGAEEVPWNVAQSIRQRVAALPVTAQELLSVAAIIGRQMQRLVLMAACTLSGQDMGALVGALEEVAQTHLLVEAGEDAYQFPHDLIREIIAADLSTARRASLHQQVADVLAQQPGEPPLEALAYHYTRSDQREKAIVYLERALAHAQVLYAHAEAEGYARSLIERLDQLGRGKEGGRAREQLGKVLHTVGRFDQAQVVLEQAVALAEAAGDVEGRWKALGQLAEVYGSGKNAAEGLARLQPWLTSSEAADPSLGLATLYAQLAWLYTRAGQLREALAAAERAVQLAHVLADQAVLARAAYWRATALLNLGQTAAGFQAIQTVIPLAEAAGDLRNLGWALGWLGTLSLDRGAFEASARALERALEIAEQIGDVAGLIVGLRCRGELAFYQGDWQRAREDYERAAAMTRQTGQFWAAVQPLYALGQLALAQGQWDTASHSLEETIALAERIEVRWVLLEAQGALVERDLVWEDLHAAWSRLEPLLQRFDPQQPVFPHTYLLNLAWIRLQQGDQTQAEAHLEQAIARATAEENRIALGDALRVKALLLLRFSHWQAAQETLEEALTLAQAMPAPYAEAKALYVSGRLYQAQGQPDQARQRWEAALVICARLGERLYAERIEAAHAKLEG